MYQCPACGATSHNPTDAVEGYCGRCQAFTGVAIPNETMLAIVVIYHNPADYPGKYVARRQWATSGTVTAELEPIAVTATLDGARESVPPGLYRLDRMAEDDATIVETWI